VKTLAAILVAQREPLVVEEIEVPEPTFGQALVRIDRSAICGSQLGEIDGVKGADPYLPHLLGHEGIGTVEAIGPCVTTVAPGDRVVLHWRPGAGVEGPPPHYRWGHRKVNAGRVTTFQGHAIVSENRITRVPPEIDPGSAVLYGCALLTAYGVLANDAQLKLGESLVILGAGGVGQSLVLLAALAGAYPIVAVDLYPAKLELARRLGATHVVCNREGDPLRAILAAVGPRGADVVVENTGVPPVMALAYDVTAPRGRTILVGVPRHDVRLSIDTMPLHFGKVLTGSHGGDASPEIDIPRLVRLQGTGRLDPRPLLTHEVDLARINDGIALLRSGEAARCTVRTAPGH
jgi:S-(hydroxymethyl)glutathione dehydrogenase/alcohol dehydrogenase